MTDFEPEEGEARALKKRGLTLDTCRKWDYLVGDGCQIANYRDDLGNLVGQKLRYEGKEFSVNGTIKDILYGRHLWRDSGRRVIVTEGEIDALTVSQVQDNKWPVVSIPTGVQSAKKTLSANLQWLNSFDTVVLCFDMDEPGRAGVQECAKLFPPGKLRIVNLPPPYKDPNEMLQAGKTEELVRALWDAKEYRPDGIVSVADLRERVLRDPEEGLPYFLPSLTRATYGRRYGECCALGAGTGVGKTTWISQQIAFDLQELRVPVAVFALEQHPAETVKNIVGINAKRRFHIPGAGWTQEELVAAVDALAEGPKLHLYDHFGACDWGVIKERIRFLAHAEGVRIFYLDHLTALAAAADDERKALEEIMAEIGSLVKELDIWLLFVSHLATPDGTPHEEGGRVTIRHFKGSRAIGYWSHFMFGLERDQQSEDPDERSRTVFRVLKDRYTGNSTGFTLPLSYDDKAGLLQEGPADLFQDQTEDF